MIRAHKTLPFYQHYSHGKAFPARPALQETLCPLHGPTAPLSPRWRNWLGPQPPQGVAPDKHPLLAEQKQHAENRLQQSSRGP